MRHRRIEFSIVTPPAVPRLFAGRWLARPFFVLCFVTALSVFSHAEQPIDETEILPVDRKHWAYLKIESPAPPKVTNSDWPRTPIDCFVLARLETDQLEPGQDASRATLIRRVYLDLLGLPPSVREVQRFVTDEKPGAYRRLVEKVLASHEYGQRWAQYWLDLARFADTDGFEHDRVRPTAWKYRDWVIAAWNRDLPYNEFVRQQIAGDLLAADEPQAEIATAFCVSGPDMPDINLQDERRHVLLNEMTSTIGAVFLSLQVGCAQCHDHKYDAISQADFYRLRAFFDSSIKLQKNKSVSVLGLHNSSPQSRLMIRGDWRRPGPPLHPAVPRVVESTDVSGRTRLAKRRDAASRMDLAKWLTSTRNPLTARSIVNRVWQHHFGRGLSTTPNDFGVMGEEPTHPALLDYLATDLMKSGWSLKRLQRNILLSRVYQIRSTTPSQADALVAWTKSLSRDPDNRLLSRFPRRRLQAETIRDCLLAVSGALNREVDGPGSTPKLPIELINTLKGDQWKTSPRLAEHNRRSVYLFARRNLRLPFFATFDRPTADQPCAARVQSTTPIQSLELMNSEIAMDAANKLSEVIARSVDKTSGRNQIRELYWRVLGRKPEADEIEACETFLRDADVGFVDLCRVCLNTNEFLFLE